MSKLDDAYNARDRSRLDIGAAALEIIEQRAREDEQAGHTAPHRTILSEVLTQLSQEYSAYHASAKACRSYLSDSIRLSRYFTPEVVEELKPYKLTSAHMLACLLPGEWPEANVTATQNLVTWAIENHASPQEVWSKRRNVEKQLNAEQVAWERVLRSIYRYLAVSASLSGETVEARRKQCNEFASTFFGVEGEKNRQ